MFIYLCPLYCLSSANNNWVSRLLRTMFLEQERLPEVVRVDESLPHESVELALCVVGLMGAYLVWGLLQEKIMTTVTITLSINNQSSLEVNISPDLVTPSI